MKAPLVIYTNDQDRAEVIWQHRHMEMEMANASSLELHVTLNGVQLTYKAMSAETCAQKLEHQCQLDLFAQPS